MDHGVEREQGEGGRGRAGGPRQILLIYIRTIIITISLCVIVTARNNGYETTDAFHQPVIPTLLL